MLRRTIAGAGVSALLAGSLLVAAPTAEAHPRYHPWGTTHSKDYILRPGCHSYSYRYHVTAPTNEWSAEMFVVNPNGRTILSNAVDSASDRARGRLHVRVCRPSTVYGKHKIKMKVTWQRDREVHDGYTKPSTFRFKRPR